MEKAPKQVVWMGKTLKDLVSFPESIKKDIGVALHIAQMGEKADCAIPFKGVGNGVFEIKANFNTDTYRAVYAVNIKNTLYVLHCFQKKAKKGIATPKQDVDLIKQRYKEALELSKV